MTADKFCVQTRSGEGKKQERDVYHGASDKSPKIFTEETPGRCGDEEYPVGK